MIAPVFPIRVDDQAGDRFRLNGDRIVLAENAKGRDDTHLLGTSLQSGSPAFLKSANDDQSGERQVAAEGETGNLRRTEILASRDRSIGKAYRFQELRAYAGADPPEVQSGGLIR
jgi:hypothetical protein